MMGGMFFETPKSLAHRAVFPDHCSVAIMPKAYSTGRHQGRHNLQAYILSPATGMGICPPPLLPIP